MNNANLNKIPDHRLVILHYLTSGLAFLVLMVTAVLVPSAFTGHYFSPELLAMTHLAVFGWISMIIFGALYQLLPVISGNSLYSEKLAYITYGLLMPGIPLLVTDFWDFDLFGIMHYGGALILLAVAGFTVNLFKTLSGKEASLEKDFIGTSGVWLLVTVLLGLFFTLNLQSAFLPREHLVYLKLHAHTGAAGWFLSLIMGVGARLVPMFSLAHNLKLQPLRWAYWLLQGGLVIMIIQRMLDIKLLGFFTWGCLIISVINYLTYIKSAYRKRMRKNPDTGMKITFGAFITLLVPVVLGSLLTWWQQGSLGAEWSLIYGVTFILGFVGLLIIGQTFKTFPFIIWMALLQPFAGQAKIPMPQDLVASKLLVVNGLLYGLGLLVLLTGIALQQVLVVQSGCLFLLIGTLFYNFGLYRALAIAWKAKKSLNYGAVNNT